jgi:tRNA(Ile)-lysidine synthase
MSSRQSIAVAVSGGRDSMALLHCTARVAGPFGLGVVALHVNHGLMPDADDWAKQVERSCARWSVAFETQRLVGKPAGGESVEAWARRGRYRALAAMARASGVGLVLLAHHRRDQAETFLLQALRGAGPAGLAAMPSQVERDGIVWARPWLNQGQEAIAAYARRHRLRFVDDPSNADPRYARSCLRAQVMPALRQAFAGAESLLAASAARSAEAQTVLTEVAQADLAALRDGAALRLLPWRALSESRRRNALRAWLRERLGRGAQQTLIERLMDELAGAGPAQWPCDGGLLRRYRGRLTAAVDPVGRTAAGFQSDDGPSGLRGALHSVAVEQGGIALDLLRDARWRARCGGERFQRAPGTPPRSLKKQFQAAGVPAWQRDAPLLFSADGRLLFVPGLGIDARALAATGEAQVALSWKRQR